MNCNKRKDPHDFGRLPFTDIDGQLQSAEEGKDEKSNENSKTDDEKTAPMEILAEFLSSLMSKDYKKALKYCELILKYEPENKTVKDFHPMILEKIKAEEKPDREATETGSSSSGESEDSSSTLRNENGSENEETSCDETNGSQSSSGSNNSRINSDSSENSASFTVPQQTTSKNNLS